MIKGILFDMDGVLVHSQKLNFRAWNIALKGICKPLTWKEFKKLLGKTESTIAIYLSRSRKVRIPKSVIPNHVKIYISLIKKEITLYYGVRPLLNYLRRNKFKMLITSSAYNNIIKYNAKKLGIRKYFIGILGKSDVTHRKPSPDIYRKAHKKLGLKAKECVVFEDSLVGVTAAKRAGCYCIAVTSSFSRKELNKDGADLIVSRLDDKKVFKFIKSIS